jgi:hypothetical protein
MKEKKELLEIKKNLILGISGTRGPSIFPLLVTINSYTIIIFYFISLLCFY